MLNKYKGTVRVHRIRDPDGDGIAFLQGSGGGHGKSNKAKEKDGNGDGNSTPNCWHCGKPGHHKNQCPKLVVEGIDNLNVNEWDDAHALFAND